MPAPITTPSNPAGELFQDSFRALAIVLTPQDVINKVRAFEPVTLAVSVRAPYIDAGLVPPLELVIVSPDGRHSKRDLPEVPLAVLFIPEMGGPHTATLREVAHNQWSGSVTVDILGDTPS